MRSDNISGASTAPIEKIIERIVERPLRRRLPDTRNAKTHKFDVAGHEGYITVGLYSDGSPGEMFITMAKEGSTIGGLMDTIATLVSLALQYGVPVESLVRKFEHVRFEPSGMTRNSEIPFAKSIVDYIFRWLAMEFVPGYRAANAPKRGEKKGAPPVNPPQAEPSHLPSPSGRGQGEGLGLTPSPFKGEGGGEGQSTPSRRASPSQPEGRGDLPSPSQGEGRGEGSVLDELQPPLRRTGGNGNGGNGNGGNGHGHHEEEPSPALELRPKVELRPGSQPSTRLVVAADPLSQQSSNLQADAPACDVCGSITVRSGTCYKCLNCGNSMGCS